MVRERKPKPDPEPEDDPETERECKEAIAKIDKRSAELFKECAEFVRDSNAATPGRDQNMLIQSWLTQKISVLQILVETLNDKLNEPREFHVFEETFVFAPGEEDEDPDAFFDSMFARDDDDDEPPKRSRKRKPKRKPKSGEK
jgi:hypothetical protein